MNLKLMLIVRPDRLKQNNNKNQQQQQCTSTKLKQETLTAVWMLLILKKIVNVKSKKFKNTDIFSVKPIIWWIWNEQARWCYILYFTWVSQILLFA